MKFQLLHTSIALALFLSLTAISQAAEPIEQSKPNIIIIFTDDQGYQDLGCYGSPDIKTPIIDKMAEEGMKFTSFYAQTVCGPSRAALMTGSYPYRNSRADDGSNPHPAISASEITIPETLKPIGYSTGMIGKWDLAGHSQTKFQAELSPEKQGFDYSYWTPSSNDSFVNIYQGQELIKKREKMSKLTSLYTTKAIDFITQEKDNPFFLYLAHSLPHTKLAVSAKFKGKSKGGLYGDVIEELDHNVGRILDHIKQLNLDDNTYIIFTSDNGPWWVKKDHSGHCEPLRGAKTSTYEGGLRVPFIIRAPGKVPQGTSSDLVTATIDILPTIASLTGAQAPQDRVIDGIDISKVFSGEQQQLDRAYFYYQHKSLRAVRHGEWKLHLAHTEADRQNEGDKWRNHIPKADRPYIEELTLYNLNEDIGETTNIAEKNPEKVQELLLHLDYIKQDLGHQDQPGKNARRSETQKINTPQT